MWVEDIYTSNKKSDECLNPECNHKRYLRGLCVDCHSIATSLVVRNKTTWEILVKKGKALELTIDKTEQWFLGK